MKARGMTCTQKNILSAFEATGIHPVNERRVMDPDAKKAAASAKVPRPKFPVPATPAHGRSIIIHGRRTLKALPDATPRSQYNKLLVEKLVNAAARATADNVVLAMENLTLRQKATSAADRAKTRSRKELSKAQVISSANVVKIREKQEQKEKEAAEKKARAAERRAKTNESFLKKIRAKATPPKKRNKQKKKKVVIDCESVDSGSENNSEGVWEEQWSSGGEGNAPGSDIEEVIVVATTRITRSRSRAT